MANAPRQMMIAIAAHVPGIDPPAPGKIASIPATHSALSNGNPIIAFLS
jgi:hypothetical protein